VTDTFIYTGQKVSCREKSTKKLLSIFRANRPLFIISGRFFRSSSLHCGEAIGSFQSEGERGRESVFKQIASGPKPVIMNKNGRLRPVADRQSARSVTIVRDDGLPPPNGVIKQ
jgi:hypothetical protein